MNRQDINTEPLQMQARPVPADKTSGRGSGVTGNVPGGTGMISRPGDNGEAGKGDPEGTHLRAVMNAAGKTLAEKTPEGKIPAGKTPAGKTPKKRPYVPPFIGGEIVLRTGNPVLGSSPSVQPGGGGGGSISIEDPIEDPGDNELIGARMQGFHADWGN